MDRAEKKIKITLPVKRPDRNGRRIILSSNRDEPEFTIGNRLNRVLIRGLSVERPPNRLRNAGTEIFVSHFGCRRVERFGRRFYFVLCFDYCAAKSERTKLDFFRTRNATETIDWVLRKRVRPMGVRYKDFKWFFFYRVEKKTRLYLCNVSGILQHVSDSKRSENFQATNAVGFDNTVNNQMPVNKRATFTLSPGR